MIIILNFISGIRKIGYEPDIYLYNFTGGGGTLLYSGILKSWYELLSSLCTCLRLLTVTLKDIHFFIFTMFSAAKTWLLNRGSWTRSQFCDGLVRNFVSHSSCTYIQPSSFLTVSWSGDYTLLILLFNAFLLLFLWNEWCSTRRIKIYNNKTETLTFSCS